MPACRVGKSLAQQQQMPRAYGKELAEVLPEVCELVVVDFGRELARVWCFCGDTPQR